MEIKPNQPSQTNVLRYIKGLIEYLTSDGARLRSNNYKTNTSKSIIFNTYRLKLASFL